MKKYIGILCVLALFAGCNKEQQNPDEEDCLVSISLVGEITTSDAPLTKAATDDLYIVQVYRGASAFAMGVVDDPSGISINLKKGAEKYRIIISLLKNGKKRLGNNYLSSPSSLLISNVGTFYPTYHYPNYIYHMLINELYYNSIGPFGEYHQGKISYKGSSSLSFPNIGYANIYGDKYPQCDEWFYGEINNYSPTGSYETLPLELKRVGFKVKYELSGVTDGEVTVKVYNSTKSFINRTTSTATYISNPVFFAFYDIHSAWQYANDYSENFTLSVSWLRGIGITEDYGTKTIQLKRNCLNNIKISMGNNDQSAGMSVTAEAESSIGSDNIVIPVQ